MPKDKSERYKNPRSAVAEESIISLCASDTALAKKAMERISGGMFTSPLLGKVFDIIAARAREGIETDMSVITESLSEDEATHIAAVFARRSGLVADGLPDYIEIIQREHMKQGASGDDAAILAAAEFFRKKKGV